MTTVTFSQLRNNARKYFDAVERGEQIQVYRHGKPVAIISPVQTDRSKYWREERPNPLVIPGASLSEAILAEREEQYGK